MKGRICLVHCAHIFKGVAATLNYEENTLYNADCTIYLEISSFLSDHIQRKRKGTGLN